jgi:hypothetical protein
MPTFSRHVERRFKPILWVLADGVPIGYAAEDVSRLARRGATWLERAGVGEHDVVVSALEPAPTVAYWQLVLGCRRAGVSALHVGPGADAATLAALAPSVLAGDPLHLTSLLAEARRHGDQRPGPRTVLAVGPPLGGEQRARLMDAAGGAAVVGAWAPSGVRAAWSECRPGASGPVPTGYHTWSDDLLENGSDGVAEGELIWTGIGWGGTALLRLRTFARAGVATGVCPACGAPGARVMPHGPVPGTRAQPLTAGNGRDALAPVRQRVESVLGQDPEVAAWLVEYRTVNELPETIVTVAPASGVAVGPLLQRLDRDLRVTQFVVLPADEVAAKVRAAGGRVVGAPVP